MPLLRTPLYDRHVAQHARMVPFAGWDMPVQYAGIVAEHRAVRTAVGVFDISHMARFDLTGADAAALLERVFTNSVATLAEGQVRYGLVCREDGGILDDILVYRWADSFSAVVNAANRDKIAAWLARHRDTGDVAIHDRTFETAMLAVQGPRAAEVLTGLLPDDPSDLKYYFARRTRYRGQPATVSRTGYTGEDGFEIVVPAEWAGSLWDEILGRGAVPCGLGARDTLRLEAGMPLYGHELTEAITPLQAGLAWAVKLDKGEFIGRDALRSADPTRPVRVGLELASKRAAREGCPVLTPDGGQVGTVTSGSYCPWLDKSLAMAYVQPGCAAAGTPLAVDVRGATIPAVVVPLPFYSRRRGGPNR